MFEKLAQIEKSYEELTEQISSPDITSDMKAYTKAMKQHRSLSIIVEKYREVKKLTDDLAGAKELAAAADDDEMKQMALAEVAEIEAKLPDAEEELKFLLLPQDPNDKRTLSSKFAPGPAATKQRSLLPTCCGCMPATPNGRAGRWRCLRPRIRA